MEAQQEEDVVDTRVVKPAATPAEAARATRRATLELARTRALADLGTASAPAHRSMLEQSIAALDRLLE